MPPAKPEIRISGSHGGAEEFRRATHTGFNIATILIEGVPSNGKMLNICEPLPTTHTR